MYKPEQAFNGLMDSGPAHLPLPYKIGTSHIVAARSAWVPE